MFLDVVLFMLKYAPYWGFPVIILSAHLVYIYWLKESWVGMAFFGLLGLLAVIFVGYYFFHGGPLATGALWNLIHATEN